MRDKTLPRRIQLRPYFDIGGIVVRECLGDFLPAIAEPFMRSADLLVLKQNPRYQGASPCFAGSRVVDGSVEVGLGEVDDLALARLGAISPKDIDRLEVVQPVN